MHEVDYPIATGLTGLTVGAITWIAATVAMGPFGFFFGWLPAWAFARIAVVFAPVLWFVGAIGALGVFVLVLIVLSAHRSGI